jgi:hypothetical protein
MLSTRAVIAGIIGNDIGDFTFDSGSDLGFGLDGGDSSVVDTSGMDSGQDIGAPPSAPMDPGQGIAAPPSAELQQAMQTQIDENTLFASNMNNI